MIDGKTGDFIIVCHDEIWLRWIEAAHDVGECLVLENRSMDGAFTVVFKREGLNITK